MVRTGTVGQSQPSGRPSQQHSQFKTEIIGMYPQHFAVESQEYIDFTIEYMSGPNDWFVDSPYLDQAWTDEETRFYEYMVDAGWMDADQPLPRFEVVGGG